MKNNIISKVWMGIFFLTLKPNMGLSQDALISNPNSVYQPLYLIPPVSPAFRSIDYLPNNLVFIEYVNREGEKSSTDSQGAKTKEAEQSFYQILASYSLSENIAFGVNYKDKETKYTLETQNRTLENKVNLSELVSSVAYQQESFLLGLNYHLLNSSAKGFTDRTDKKSLNTLSVDAAYSKERWEIRLSHTGEQKAYSDVFRDSIFHNPSSIELGLLLRIKSQMLTFQLTQINSSQISKERVDNLKGTLGYENKEKALNYGSYASYTSKSYDNENGFSNESIGFFSIEGFANMKLPSSLDMEAGLRLTHKTSLGNVSLKNQKAKVNITEAGLSLTIKY